MKTLNKGMKMNIQNARFTSAILMLSMALSAACGGDSSSDPLVVDAECYSGGADCAGDELCLRNNTCRKIEGFGSVITVTSGTFSDAEKYYVEVYYRDQTELIKTPVSASTTSPSWHESEFFMLRGASDWWTITVKKEGFFGDSTVLTCQWELDVADFEVSNHSGPWSCSNSAGEIQWTHIRGDA